MKNFFKILLLAAVFTSCEDVEPVIYDGQEGEISFISFSRSAYALPVERDATGSVQLVINSSKLSDVDRTYNLELIPNTSSTAANPATYSFPASITIPAGSYQGFATVTGQDLNLVDENVKNFSVRITNLNDATEDWDTDRTSFNVYEVCPLLDDFTGEYYVEQITPWQTNTSLLELPIIETGIYNLEVGETIYDRQFRLSEVFATSGFALGPHDFVISFGCDRVNLGSIINTGLSCETGPPIIISPTDFPEDYDTEDDSVFEITVTENSAEACNAPTREITIRFTKVE